MDNENTNIKENKYKTISILINDLKTSDLKLIITDILKYYPNKFDSYNTSSIYKLIYRLYGTDIDAEKIFREFYFFLTECFYYRLSNKLKNELISINYIPLEKIDIIYFYLNEHNRNNLNDDFVNDVFTPKIIDFEIETKLPLSKTNNKLIDEDNSYHIKNDYKQQELEFKIKLELPCQLNNNDKSKNSMVTIKSDKKMASLVFEEIEKLQEKLDTLY